MRLRAISMGGQSGWASRDLRRRPMNDRTRPMATRALPTGGLVRRRRSAPHYPTERADRAAKTEGSLQIPDQPERRFQFFQLAGVEYAEVAIQPRLIDRCYLERKY